MGSMYNWFNKNQTLFSISRRVFSFALSVSWLRSTWMKLVAGKIVSLGIVGANSSWISKGFELGAMVVLILKESLDIFLGEFTVKTLLHILDFRSDSLIIVVKGGLIDKSLVQHTFKKEIEVGHESSVVTILVFHEDGIEFHVDFIFFWVDSLNTRETGEELDCAKDGETPHHSENSDTRVRLGHSLEETEMERSDPWNSSFLLVLIEPEVVR